LLLTFAVSGIWHGSGFKFLFWGLLHGFYQIMGDILKPLNEKMYSLCKNEQSRKILDCVRIFITFMLVMIAWIIFRADSLKVGLSMIKSIITVWNPWVFTNDSIFGLGLSWKELLVLNICLVILFFVSKKQEQGIEFRERILGYNLIVRWIIYISAILFIMIFGTYGFGFDPQAFIYGGF